MRRVNPQRDIMTRIVTGGALVGFGHRPGSGSGLAFASPIEI
jgi:hypothetical protein